LVESYTPSLALSTKQRPERHQTQFLAGFLVFGEIGMPNHKSAEKRVRQNEKRRQINRGHRTKVRTYIKKLRSALDSEEKQQIDQMLPEAISVIDKSVQKGVLHANAAARYKSRLTVSANRAGK
jgi:small subunit ribosomal protein S20